MRFLLSSISISHHQPQNTKQGNVIFFDITHMHRAVFYISPIPVDHCSVMQFDSNTFWCSAIRIHNAQIGKEKVPPIFWVVHRPIFRKAKPLLCLLFVGGGILSCSYDLFIFSSWSWSWLVLCVSPKPKPKLYVQSVYRAFVPKINFNYLLFSFDKIQKKRTS